MNSVPAYRYFKIAIELLVYIAVSLAVLALFSVANAQTRTPRVTQPGAQAALPAPQADEPVLREYRGVHIGMSQEQARQRLGTPGDVSDRQDFYTISGMESAQVFYDAQKKVMAVSVSYLGESSGAPTPEKVFGTAAEVKPDGSIYKLVRYQRAGYFVVYSRTAGDAPPLINVIMQKIVD